MKFLRSRFGNSQSFAEFITVCRRGGFALALVGMLGCVSCHKPTLKQSSPPVTQEVIEAEPEKLAVEVQPPRLTVEKPVPVPNIPAAKSSIGNSRELDIKYPLGRTITDSKGQKIKVTIIGKDPNSIFLIRKSDRMQVTFPIAKLSAKDQTFVSFLPIKSPPPVAKSGPDSKEAGYLAIRENDLKRLRQQARSMKQNLVANRNKLLIKRGIEGRLNVLEGQIRLLEEQLRSYKVSRGIPVK